MALDVNCAGLLRAVCIGLGAVLLGYCGAAAMASRSRGIRVMAWALVISCFFAPPLLIGYAYANFTGFVRGSEAAKGGFYALLVLARMLPVAAVIWLMCPGRVSREAWHCLRLLWPQLSGLQRARHVWQMLRCGAMTTGVAVFGVIFVLAFTEFELASFLGVRQWTIAIFDAQVGGMLLSESLRRVAWPALTSLTVAMLVVLVLGFMRGGARNGRGGHVPDGRWAALGLCVLACGALLTAVVPGSLVLRGVWPDAFEAMRSFGLQRELGSSLLVAVAAAALAFAVARVACAWAGRQRGQALRLAGLGVMLVPGLLGGLVLGLCVLALMQAPCVWILRSTPLPFVFAAMLMVVPIALLMQLLLRRGGRAADVHVAQLLGRSPWPAIRRRAATIRWVRGTRPLFWAGALLVYPVFSDVTLSSLLAPVRMPLVMPRLYNFMHYGRSAALTASLLICVLVPIALLVLSSITCRFWRAWHAAYLDA
jgi:ABC-type Fe3+ transport system permease subunit